jgi:hypothetical protein
MSKTIRFLLNFAFVYTCIEGLIVNMTYPNPFAYIAKDAVLALIYLALLTENRPGSGSLSKLSGPMIVFATLVVFYIAMPTRVGLLSQAVAVKQRLFYIPMMYVAYWTISSEDDIYRVLRLMALTAIPTSIFGVYLYFAGPSALELIGGRYSAVIFSTVGASGVNFWRVPGTFTSPGQYALYLLVQATLITGMLLGRKQSLRDRVLYIVALVTVLGGMLASGSRTPVMIYFLCLALVLLYNGRLTKMGGTAVGLYVVFAVGFSYFGDGVQDRIGSILSYEHVERFQSTYFGQMFLPRLMESPMGMGLGVATIGARHFTEWSNVMLVESYFGVLVYEMGFLGLAVFMWAMAKIVLTLLGLLREVSSAIYQPLWCMMGALVLVIISMMTISTGIDSAPGNLYFWYFIGALVKLADLRRAARISAAVPSEYPVWATGTGG